MTIALRIVLPAHRLSNRTKLKDMGEAAFRIFYQRQALRGAMNFKFCDDFEVTKDLNFKQPRRTLVDADGCAPLQDVIVRGVSASSCDDFEQQSIGSYAVIVGYSQRVLLDHTSHCVLQATRWPKTTNFGAALDLYP